MLACWLYNVVCVCLHKFNFTCIDDPCCITGNDQAQKRSHHQHFLVIWLATNSIADTILRVKSNICVVGKMGLPVYVAPVNLVLLGQIHKNVVHINLQAYVDVFSRALQEEVRGTGVIVQVYVYWS